MQPQRKLCPLSWMVSCQQNRLSENDTSLNFCFHNTTSFTPSFQIINPRTTFYQCENLCASICGVLQQRAAINLRKMYENTVLKVISPVLKKKKEYGDREGKAYSLHVDTCELHLLSVLLLKYVWLPTI